MPKQCHHSSSVQPVETLKLTEEVIHLTLLLFCHTGKTASATLPETKPCNASVVCVMQLFLTPPTGHFYHIIYLLKSWCGGADLLYTKEKICHDLNTARLLTVTLTGEVLSSEIQFVVQTRHHHTKFFSSF